MKNNINYFNVPESLITGKCEDLFVVPEYRTEFMRERLMDATVFRRLARKT